MADWIRNKALMSMTTTLGADALIPTHMVADEKISHPFSFEITVVSQIGVVAPDDILNLAVCVVFNDDTGPVRYFHGIVQEIISLGIMRGADAADEFNSYSLIVRPRLWYLNQTRDCRVYQNMTVTDMLTSLFNDAGLTDVSFSVTGGAARPYTIQFNETDYNFAVRLMEEEGWFYYFVHTASKHTLYVTDNNAGFPDTGVSLHFGVADNDIGAIQEWRIPVSTATGSFTTADYDPENPGTKLYNIQKTVLKTGGGDARDEYRWPALTNVAATVSDRATFEIEAAEALTSLYQGISHYGGLVPGAKFTLTNAPAGPDDGAFAIRAVRHVIEDSTWITSDGTVSYGNWFEAFKAAKKWRQPLRTPRPRMDGIHTALVLGPTTAAATDIKMQTGEEIYTDDLARVKVRFFWDWRADATGSASCWARVIQPWAGNGWGMQFIPRVGTEVAVAFVDGDPDRPIVIGGLYNGVSAPIYAVADKTKSGIRTRSSLAGSSSQFNELTFDDKSGSELIFIHAEKDMTTEVEHDEHLTVNNCRVVEVDADETITVKGNQTITITKDHVFEVTKGKFAVTIDQGDSTFTVTQGNHTSKISTGNSSYDVAQGNHSMKVDMGNHSTEVTMGNHDLKVDLGNITVKAAAGTISMEAMTSITLKVGSNSLVIDTTGVTIKGTMLAFTGTATATLKSAMTTVSGDGGLTLQGALVKIN
jgi:type VI secretion system secreted protein VgrG